MDCMKVCVVTSGAARLPECDVALFGFERLGAVDYESELSGKSEKFEEVARLSRAADCGVVCGCITSSRGAVRKSAAAACSGKLLGISDMCRVFGDEEYKSGASLGLYMLGGCRAGVLIENDIYFPECMRSLAACGCSVVLFLSEGLRPVHSVLMRAYAYLYGVPVIGCAGRTALFAETSGGLATSNLPLTLFETSRVPCWRTVASRMRGAAEDDDADF